MNSDDEFIRTTEIELPENIIEIIIELDFDCE